MSSLHNCTGRFLKMSHVIQKKSPTGFNLHNIECLSVLIEKSLQSLENCQITCNYICWMISIKDVGWKLGRSFIPYKESRCFLQTLAAGDVGPSEPWNQWWTPDKMMQKRDSWGVEHSQGQLQLKPCTLKTFKQFQTDSWKEDLLYLWEEIMFFGDLIKHFVCLYGWSNIPL